MASQNHLLRLHNSIRFTSSTPPSPSTNHSIQSTTRPTPRSRNFPFINQRGNRRNYSENTRLLQQHVCNSEEKRQFSSCFQSQTTQRLYSGTTFQNGNITRSYQTNQVEQLFDIHRPVRCIPSYSCSPRLSSLSPFELERQNIPVLHNSIWPVIGSLVIHQAHKTNSGMGSLLRNSTQCVSRRLDHHCRLKSSSYSAYPIGCQETQIIRMDHQLCQINSETATIARAPRLLIEYHKNDSQTTREKITRLTAQYSTNSPETSSITTYHSQPHHENSISNFCIDTGLRIHATPTEDEESDCTLISRLGQTIATTSRMHSGTYMVEKQSHSLERQKYSTTNTSTDCLCRCQQQWIGLQFTSSQQQTTNSLRPLVSPRGPNVYQLARTQGCFSRFEDFPSPQEYAHSYLYRQYNLNGIYEQTRWHPIPSINGISNSIVEMVPQAWNNYSIHPYFWDQQHNYRLRISPSISEEQLDDCSLNLCSYSTSSGSKRRRSFCRPDYETATKIRVGCCYIYIYMVIYFECYFQLFESISNFYIMESLT
ncbi:hypothetical protein INT45_010582 [Circinella minor]|uniref:Uncharacterized protein n=1 Tax=Circinella minor TaxID=1195481 RepID=A0A8H7RI20_9FUNG|nr:hypothetical protein INT45_010582 [Circinella minor]